MNPRMKNLIEVSVDSIRIHMPTAQHLVILKEKEADRYLPIWIGSFEAQAIAAKISGNSVGRPLTHDLMANAFGDLGVSIKRIVVTRLADQVFYARLYVKQDGRDLDFDARPSVPFERAERKARTGRPDRRSQSHLPGIFRSASDEHVGRAGDQRRVRIHIDACHRPGLAAGIRRGRFRRRRAHLPVPGVRAVQGRSEGHAG
ncbi:MAG: bifunctional nuclease family protein [Chloroflexi bacterium]|nr:MAG: bifunctional nuclease family protein [Chloroflexota bacterium]